MRQNNTEKELFGELKSGFLDFDPAYFIQNNLTLDGEEFKILGNGWKFMADVYRYIALQATQHNGKSIVIKKGRQVGATMMAGALDLYFTNSGLFDNPPIRVLHLFPSLPLVKKFTQDKLEGLIRTAKGDFVNQNKLKSQNAVDNLTMKQFKTGTLWVDSLGVDGDRVRGMTVDAIFYDEFQEMIGHAVGNANKTLTAAKYGPIGRGIQVYFGTPKQRSSYFNTVWEMSDQRYYHLGCVKCKETFPFYLPNDDRWRTIWVSEYTIECPLCQHRQHKVDAIENGQWIASRDTNECQYVGFQINQLYIPYFAKEDILKLRPENNPTMSERLWNNEVIGEFYSGAGLPLTKQEVLENCIDSDRYFAKHVDPKVKRTYLGLDWGHKVDNDLVERGQSYSCAVVLSATSDNILLVEHAHKLRERGIGYKIDTVDEIFRRFAIRQAASDWMFGQDVVNELQIKYRDRFLGAMGSGTAKAIIKYDPEQLMIMYNKDLIIDEVLELLRKGKIRFPGKSYEHCEWLIEHCTSMDLEVRTRSGQPMKTYQKGSTQNDGLMALIYAYMAYKFDITKAFTIKPGFEEKKSIMMPKLAYVPKLRV